MLGNGPLFHCLDVEINLYYLLFISYFETLHLDVNFLLSFLSSYVVNDFVFFLVLPTSTSDSGQHTWSSILAAGVPECPRTADHAQQPHSSDSYGHEHHTYTT